MSLSELKTRRSIRKYTDQEVEKEKIDKIIKGALMSPSANNNCPWEFIVVTDDDVLDKLADSKTGGSQFLADASVGIVVCADPKVSDVWIEDAAIVSMDMMLAAEELNLGSCWIQIRNRMHSEDEDSNSYVKRTLDIPDNLEVDSIISIGYPAEEKGAHKEEDLLYDKVHFNKFKDKYYK